MGSVCALAVKGVGMEKPGFAGRVGVADRLLQFGSERI